MGNLLSQKLSGQPEAVHVKAIVFVFSVIPYLPS